MTPERWRRVEELFQAAVIRAPEEREAWLQDACAGDSDLLNEVRKMVSADEQGGDEAEQIASAAAEMVKTPLSSEPVLRAGPYRLTRLLGRGGMGAVYLGERADGEYDAEVAVKLVHAGMDTAFFLDRFRRERQALARLQHPNIARILDSGTTDTGLPYIVMELVRGIPITTYVKDKQLSRDEILGLFLEVCRAVSHAHHKFIVHRDLKPANIFVDADRTVKLLDFGICKLLEDTPRGTDALTAALLLTPDYASPEQLKGAAVSLTSDVFSLGVILYELLTGRLPRAMAKLTPAAIAAAAEEPIPPPSQYLKDTGGTEPLRRFDAVILKAVQNDPEKRYQSVDLLMEDLQRVMNKEQPLAELMTAAEPPKRSRRWWVMGGVAAALLGVVFAWTKHGPVTEPVDVNTLPAFLEAHRLLKAKVRNETAEDRLRRSTRAIELFEQAAREHPHAARVYAGLAEAYEGIADEAPGKYYYYLNLAAVTAAKGLALDERLDDLHHTRGSALLFGAWDLPKALASFTRAVELNPRRGHSHRMRAEVLCMFGRFEEAMAALNAAQAMSPLDTEIGAEKAAIYFRWRRYAQAAEAARQTLAIDPDHDMAGWTLGMALQHQGSIAEAEKILRGLPFRPVRNPIALAHLLASSGRKEEAFTMLNRVRQVADHPSAEAVVYVALGDRATALTMLEKALAAHEMNVLFVSMDPRYDAIRAEPRWIALCQKLGVPPNP